MTEIPSPLVPAINPWLKVLQDRLCDAAGGFLFGVPLLYTVEVWTIGELTQPVWLLGALGIAFAVIFLLVRTEGPRRSRDPSIVDAAIESIEALALGIVCAAIALLLLRRITPATPLSEVAGKLVFEGIPFAFGAGLGRSLLKRDRNAPATTTPETRGSWRGIIKDLDASAIGAFAIAFNIAPTDEVKLLVGSIPSLWLLLIMGASLFLSYLIVFAAGFTNQTQRQQQPGFLQRPLNETLLAYLLSLATSAFMLWFFHRLSPGDPWEEWLSATVILGFPVAIGGAAGRIAL